MKTISKSKLKARMLEIFRQIEKEGEELLVTDKGKPVLKIVPLRSKHTVQDLFQEYQGRVSYQEDMNTPTEAEWGKLR